MINQNLRSMRGLFLVIVAVVFITGGGLAQSAEAYVPDSVFVDRPPQQIPNSSKSAAAADNTFEHGWKWVFYVTVPDSAPHNETLLKMKFADWMNGSNVITSGGNMRYYSAQSTNAIDEAHAIYITASTTWSDIMNLNPNVDLNSENGGRQIELYVEAKIPTGSAGGSYSTSYDINTTATSSISFEGLKQTYGGTPRSVIVTTDPVGLAKTVTYTGIDITYPSSTTAPTHAGSYAVLVTVTDPGYTAISTATLVIDPAPISVVADPKTKIYDGSTTTDPILTPNLAGGLPALFASDKFTGALSRDPGEEVGCYSVTQGTLVSNSDYILSFSPSTFCITHALATVTLGNLEQTYNKTGRTVSTTTIPAGLKVDITYGGSPEVPVNAGTYPVVATINDHNYSGSTSTDLVIGKASLTVTATTSSKVYNASTTSDGLPEITSGHLFGSDSAVWVQTYDSKNVGPRILTPSDSINDGNDGHNYNITFATSSGLITPATAVVTAKGINKVYDGTTNASTTLDVSGEVGKDALTAVDTATFKDKNVGNGIEVNVTGITLSGASPGNYLYNTTASTTANITQAPLTITANNASKTYGAEMTFTGKEFTSSGLASTDTILSVTLMSGGAASTSIVGTYPITPSNPQGVDLSNYETPLYTNGTLTVTTAPVTVSADPKTKVYDGDESTDAKLTYHITSGSLFNGDSFTGSLTRTSGENVGSYPITRGSLTLGTNYNLDVIPSSLTITASTSVVSLSNLSQTYSKTGKSIGVITVPAGLNVDVTYNSSSELPVNVGKYTVVVSISSGQNYEGSATGYLVISPLPITVTAIADTKTYDGTESSGRMPTITSSNHLVGGDSVTWSQTFNDKNVGTNKVLTPAGKVVDGNNGANYDVTYVTATGVIDSRDLKVTATGVNKTYDASTVATVTLLDNRVSGDIFIDSYSKANFIDPNVANSKQVDVYEISIGGTDAGNYKLDNISASTTADITLANLTITANDKTKKYGDEVTLGSVDSGFVASGLKGTDKVSTTTLTSGGAASTSPVLGSPYKIIPSNAEGIGLTNYEITYADGKLTVDPKALTVTLQTDNKIYDGITDASTTCTITGGVLFGDEVTCVASNSHFSTRNAGSSLQVTSDLALSGTGRKNYSVNTTANTTATISQLAITVTAQANTKTYDGTTSAIAIPTISPSIGAGDTANFIEIYGNKNVGSSLSLTPSGIVNDMNSGNNYSYTFTTNANGVINPEPLTITATANIKIYDDNISAGANPTLTSGTVFNGDTAQFTETYDNKNVGTGKTLTATGIVNDTNGGSNYTYYFVPVDAGIINMATPRLSYTTRGIADGENISQIIDTIYPTAYIIGAGNQKVTVDGTFTYDPGTGSVFGKIGETLKINITFTPSDTQDFRTVTQTAEFTVTQSVAYNDLRVGPPYALLTGTPITVTSETSGVVALGMRGSAVGGNDGLN